ncbi:MAG: site-specific integrase [Muribaculaceae bacterium]|nr:site-specific integrase [Muribaculaceae bacterium]
MMNIESIFHLLIVEYRLTGKIRTAETYMTTLNSLKRFCKERPLTECEITPGFVMRFEQSLTERGLCRNTTSFYIRILRSVYNQAIERGMIKKRKADRNLFRKVYTGVDKTIKRAIRFSTIQKIFNIPIHENTPQAFARDIFILCFCLRGISFVDLCYLKKTNLHINYLSYTRRKTSQQIRITLTPEIRELITKYQSEDKIYLLPFLSSECTQAERRKAYLRYSSQINYHLRKIGERVGLENPLTLYVARHSWATAAKESGMSTQLISEGLGHNSESTTRIYLATLDTNELDTAHQALLCRLSKSKSQKK